MGKLKICITSVGHQSGTPSVPEDAPVEASKPPTSGTDVAPQVPRPSRTACRSLREISGT